MAETVTWPLLRELANFRAEKGCAVSLYLNLDPSEVPTAGDAQSRMNALLNEAEKKDRKDLTHEQRRGVLADFERIARWFDDEFDRAGSRALAVFAAGLDNYWSPMQLVQPVPDIVKVGRDFYLAPLAPAVAVPAAHREARPGPPEGRRRGTGSQSPSPAVAEGRAGLLRGDARRVHRGAAGVGT